MHTPEGTRGLHGGEPREGARFGAAGIEEVGLDEGRPNEVRRMEDEMESEGTLVSLDGATAHGPDGARRYAATGVGEACFESWAGSLERCGRDASLFLKAPADGRSSRSAVRGRA